MKPQTGLFARQSMEVAVKVFFAAVKMIFILLILVVGALIAAQSAVAPVSMRLLTSYGMEYAAYTLKPIRPYFPAPYVVEIETN